MPAIMLLIRSTISVWVANIRVGLTRSAVVVCWRGGRRPTYYEKKVVMDDGFFFFLSATDHGEGAAPSPLST
jgi:hypothetical protein